MIHLRKEGELLKRGLNWTWVAYGFVAVLVTSKKKYRFRFRPLIKPRFLWGVE